MVKFPYATETKWKNNLPTQFRVQVVCTRNYWDESDIWKTVSTNIIYYDSSQFYALHTIEGNSTYLKKDFEFTTR